MYIILVFWSEKLKTFKKIFLVYIKTKNKKLPRPLDHDKTNCGTVNTKNTKYSYNIHPTMLMKAAHSHSNPKHPDQQPLKVLLPTESDYLQGEVTVIFQNGN